MLKKIKIAFYGKQGFKFLGCYYLLGPVDIEFK